MLAYCQSNLFHGFRLHSAKLKQVWLCTHWHDNSARSHAKKILQPFNILNKDCTSAIQASLIVFDLHFLCTICRICYKVLYYGNRTVQRRRPSALPPSGTGEFLPYHVLYIFSAKSEKTIFILFFQFSGTSSQEFHFLTNL